MVLEDKIRDYLKMTGDGHLPSVFRNAFGVPGILVMDALRKMGDEVFKADDGRWYLTNKDPVDFPDPSAVSETEFSDPISAVAVFEPNPEMIDPVVEPVPEPIEPVEIKEVVAVKKSEAPWLFFRDWLRTQYNAGNTGYTIRTASSKRWNGKQECRVRDTIRAIEQLRKWGKPEDIELLENMVVEPKSTDPAPETVKAAVKKKPVVKQPSITETAYVEAAVHDTLVDELQLLREKLITKKADPVSALRWASICNGIEIVLKELGFSDESHLRIGMREMETYFVELSSS